MFKFIRKYLSRRQSTASPPAAEVVTLFRNRLTAEQYAAFEKKVSATTIVNSTTTDLQAGYQLGIQHALKVLRDGWVA